MDRSPYDEHADERRRCPECGGTKTITVGDGPGEPGCHLEDCPLCGPPSKPDQSGTVMLLLQTASMLRRAARRDPDLRAHYLDEARWHEIRAAQITGAKEVA